ncbi:MAG: hypothetical protein V7676_12480 [Parasphingorhabdus sp.]|uniref:hypothetical protein n=1 Tax=Parasphingorhabdus sp. TaxID=2709688 RepID=UPI00300131CE
MTFKSEAEMQSLIEQLLQGGSFGDAIRGKKRIERLATPAPDVLPLFAIDRVARLAMIVAARDALADIDDLIVLTSDDNISMSKGEGLRPDFICISPSTNAVYLIELKKSAQTAREAITELLGYEHEIKNYLPFLANYELNFVLISSEWSTLLDHSAMSACCWSRKKLLCLEVALENDNVVLTPRIPGSWSITGVTAFPQDSLQTFQLTLEGPAVDADGDPDPRLFVVMSLLARSGDRVGAHGFAMLWRDRFDKSGQTFHITIGGVDTAAFFETAIGTGMIDPDQGHLTKPLQEALADGCRTAPSSAIALASSIRPILEEVAPVTMEGFFDWDTAKETYFCRAEPVTFEFWGMLGDHARAYLTNPAVRENRQSLLGGGRMDWTHPILGLFLLQSFRGIQFLRDGEIRLSDAFALGSALGMDGGLREIINNADAAPVLPMLEPAFLWNAYSTAHMLEELLLVVASTQSIQPLDKIHFSFQTIQQPSAETEKLIQWLTTEVFRKQAKFIEAFNLGMRGGVAFSTPLRKAIGNQFEELRTKLAPALAGFRDWAMSLVAEATADGQLNHEQQLLAEQIRTNTDCDDQGALLVFRLLDTFQPALAHDLNAVAPSIHDWDWLKQGVRKIRETGGRPAIVLGADGMLGTMQLTAPELLIIGDVEDTEKEVLFLNNLSGLQMLLKTSWEALARGEHFPVLDNDCPS